MIALLFVCIAGLVLALAGAGAHYALTTVSVETLQHIAYWTAFAGGTAFVLCAVALVALAAMGARFNP